MVNNLTGNSGHCKGFSSINNDEGEKLDNQDAADFMNEYFSNIGKTLNENNSSKWTPHRYFEDEPLESFSLTVVSEDIIMKYIKTLCVSKPSGIPHVNNKILRDALSSIPFEITSLMNNSILNDHFPAQWKNGTITPIPKPGKLSNKSNWRPITILNTVGKLLEKIVHYQTSLYLQYREILNDNQHGFRRILAHLQQFLNF